MSGLTFPIAMKLLGQKRYQAVYDLALGALRQNEKDPLAFFFLGIVASDHSQHSKALEFFAKASEHGPRSARYQAYHAKALGALGHRKEAKQRADIAASLSNDDAFVADMIGTIYSRAGHHALALPAFQQAVKLNPKWALFQFNLGASAQFVGDIPLARSAYESAVAIDSKLYRAWFALVALEKQTDGANYLEKLKALFERSGHNADAQLLLGHSIAKTLEDLGRFPESYDWLIKAKVLQKEKGLYNEAETVKIFDAVKLSSQSASSQKPSAGKTTPIFIVGLPRTGTTLLDRILSSHPDVMSAGELDLFSAMLRDRTREADPYSPSLFGKLQKTDLNELGNDYRAELHSLSGGAPYCIDKTPLNFFYVGLIHQALPEAKIIMLRRGAMDSCLSNFRQLFALGDKRYHHTLDIKDMAKYYRHFNKLMQHWKETLPHGSFTEMSYENMVHYQEAETRRLLSFCGLEWDKACLSFHENAAATDTASSVQVRQPLYSGAIGRWKKYGDRLEVLKLTLGDLVDG